MSKEVFRDREDIKHNAIMAQWESGAEREQRRFMLQMEVLLDIRDFLYEIDFKLGQIHGKYVRNV